MSYPSPAFREDRLDVLHAAIRDIAFATLITRADDNFATRYLPFEIANQSAIGGMVAWYPEKSTDLRQVPTRDYLAVEAREFNPADPPDVP